jgi:hypothetical protein
MTGRGFRAERTSPDAGHERALRHTDEGFRHRDGTGSGGAVPGQGARFRVPGAGTRDCGMTSSYTPSVRTSPSRNAGRVSYDRAAVHAVLDEALVCHVGFVVDGQPVVLPQLHASSRRHALPARLHGCARAACGW